MLYFKHLWFLYFQDLLSDLRDQKYHLEGNTLLFYHRKEFPNLTDEEHKSWKKNEIRKLDDLAARFSDEEPVIKAPRFNSGNAHEFYSVLMGKLFK